MNIDQSETTDAAVYAKTTRGIRVTVDPTYLEHDSLPENGHYLWAYHVVIENNGDETVQLISRYWHITDGRGAVQEVQGDGVIGEQPVLRPGQSHEYTSGTPLSTPSGIMVGSYRMMTEGGDSFDIEIPAFSLDSPHTSRQIN